MTVKVSVPLTNSTTTSVSSGNTINTNIISSKTAAKLENIADIDTQGVEDGYTLIYNSTTKKWEAVNPSTSVSLTSIDGGTF